MPGADGSFAATARACAGYSRPSDSMRDLLEEKLARFEELEQSAGRPGGAVPAPQKLAAVAREHGSLASWSTKYRRFKDLNDEIADAREMIAGSDPEMRELAEAELPELIDQREEL